MSQENVEAGRLLFATFEDRDFESAATLLDPEVEVRPALVGGLENTTYRGAAGMRQFWSDIDAVWAKFQITPEEFRPVDRAVLVLGRVSARGRQSGLTLDTNTGWLAELRKGKLTRFRSFLSREEALEAAGLSE